jgi:hypothetical protein
MAMAILPGFPGFSHPRTSSMAAAHAQRERSSDENSSTRSAAAILDDLMIWMDLDGLISPTKMRNKKKTPQTLQKTSIEFRFHLCNDFHQFLTVSKVLCFHQNRFQLQLWQLRQVSAASNQFQLP